ncbi:ribonuclease J [Candidatus Poribacteria bacterium]|nr:ribonuclease J [Candidatus Poribacteria bacterium]MYA56731.1 ribonuclease J [Candidatus Poribacteria bacterium]
MTEDFEFERIEGNVSIIPLGGLGEFGLNMMVYETENDIIVVDTGFMLPNADMPGVDLILPDIHYLVERQEKIRGILLTHGHEDHIGALFYVLRQLDVPVYGTQLTLAIASGRLREYNVLSKAQLNTIAPGDTVELGDFSAEFIHVTHSIPDTVAIALRTPVGVIVHTGDFKFDMTPVDGRLSDIQTLARLGAEGVLLLASDSTNAERPGQTPSERSIYGTIDNIFQKAEQKLFLCTFSSSLHRIQQFIDLAGIHRRLVAVTGRSLLNNIRTATELGYLNVNPDYLIDARDTSMFKPHELVILSTGSQGEHRSALSLMALDNHPFLKVEQGDTVVMSARIIPGNEKAIGNVVNHLLRRGAKIYHERNADVHVSGHGSSEDLKLMLNLLQPKFFMPMHGEYQNLMRHAELAESMGIPSDNIKVAEDGELILLTPETCEVFGREGRSGRVFVDGKPEFELEDIVLRDRIQLSEDGIVVPIVVLHSDAGEDKQELTAKSQEESEQQLEGGSTENDSHISTHLTEPQGKIRTQIEIISRGFVYMDKSEELIEEVKEITQSIIENLSDEQKEETEAVQDEIRGSLRRFFSKQMQRTPLIFPVVMRV